MISKDNCVFVSSFPPRKNERAKECLSSWRKYTDNIILIQPSSEIEMVKSYYPDVEIIKTTTPPKSFEWSKPHFPNMMDFIRLTQYSDVVIINSDIELNYSLKEWSSEWELKNDKSFICGLRTNYDKKDETFAFEPYGLDVFKLPKNTFNYFKDIDSKFLIGHPGWDYWLFYKLIEFRFHYKCIFNTRILHHIHQLNWSQSDFKYAQTLYDPIFLEKDKKTLSLDGRYKVLQDFIQFKTNRVGWTNDNQVLKTFNYLKITNYPYVKDSNKINFFYQLFMCFGSGYFLILKNIINLISNFNLTYIDSKIIKLMNKTIDEFLLSLSFPLILIQNKKHNLNMLPPVHKDYFFIQNPLDILVSIYFDFINTSEETYLNIDPIYKTFLLSINREKYKNMSVDAYVKNAAPLLNEHLLKIIERKTKSDSKNCHIIYYEDIINDEFELFSVLKTILMQISEVDFNNNLVKTFPLIKDPSNFLNRESSQPGYYKKVLQEETINELNVVFKEFYDTFYPERQ